MPTISSIPWDWLAIQGARCVTGAVRRPSLLANHRFGLGLIRRRIGRRNLPPPQAAIRLGNRYRVAEFSLNVSGNQSGFNIDSDFTLPVGGGAFAGVTGTFTSALGAPAAVAVWCG